MSKATSEIEVMQIDYNIVSLIEIIGLIQGVVLGSVLLFLNRQKTKSTAFLGLFILAYSLDFVPGIIEDLNILEYYPNLLFLPLDFHWLEFSLFYIYVQKISIFSNSKISYWVLYPGIASVFINIILFLMPIQAKILIADSFAYSIYMIIGYLFSLSIGFLTIVWINRHRAEAKNQYSGTEYKELNWARLYVIIGFVFVILSLLVFFVVGDNYVLIFIVAIINVTLLYWVSLRGILQKNVHSLIAISEKNNEGNNTSNIKKETNTTSAIITKDILFKLENYIVKDEAFTKPDLTIIDVAENIKEHPKRISNIINSQLDQNFNSYINSFRIEKAKELLDGKLADNYSIEGIGISVGFQSKSTFYNAFKKVTGTTPIRYKNQ